ncbi:MAG: PD-(D/E)XK nuclease family protein [Acidimicrobiales bacterium]
MTAIDEPRAGLLALLRREGEKRDFVDPTIAIDLGTRLEIAASAALALPEGLPILITKDRLQQILLCERHLVEQMRFREREASPEMIRGQIVDLLFTLVVSGAPIGADPVSDALEADAVAQEPSLAAAWGRLDERAQQNIHDEVVAATLHLANWAHLPANAFPRLQEPMRVVLAGGRVVLLGRADLLLGRASAERVGTTLIDVKSGKRRREHVAEARWYALLDLLREGVAPFQTGNYYTARGRLELEIVERTMLEQATKRVIEGIGRMIRIASGDDPGTDPTPLCPWCPAFDDCEPGRSFTQKRDGAWSTEDDEEDA